MTILHVTDFHFNQRWYDWLLPHARPHELAVMTGDMLDISSATPQVHQPIYWHEHSEGRLYLHPGRSPAAAIPNHIIVRADDMHCEFLTAAAGERSASRLKTSDHAAVDRDAAPIAAA